MCVMNFSPSIINNSEYKQVTHMRPIKYSSIEIWNVIILTIQWDIQSCVKSR